MQNRNIRIKHIKRVGRTTDLTGLDIFRQLAQLFYGFFLYYKPNYVYIYFFPNISIYNFTPNLLMMVSMSVLFLKR